MVVAPIYHKQRAAMAQSVAQLSSGAAASYAEAATIEPEGT
jgi:hypothetical protein